MTHATNALADDVLAPIDRTARSIEETFLKAGDSLGRGLEAFQKLGSSLTAFAEDLASGTMSQASSAIEGLSRELILISDSLPADAAILQDLVNGNDLIDKKLGNLRETMRTMGVITRSARIEAVVFDRGLGLDSFTEEASRLASAVHAAINGCVADHAKLTSLIRVAAQGQSNLDRDYRERLLDLAKELLDTFAAIGRRQREGRDLMGDVAKRSDRIAQTAGMALVSLQSGDSTRQRLEHISSAVQCAIDLGGPAPAQSQIPESARTPTIAALYRLQGAQLSDTISEFRSEAATIDAAFAGLSGDVHDLVAQSQATFVSSQNSFQSFLADFKSKLSVAVDLLKTCAGFRHAVEDATSQLRVRLDGLNRTISDLNVTSRDLTLLAVNAGLRAARLGNEGRSLVVIADELKELAERVSENSVGLIQVFATVELSSHQLDRESEGASVSSVAAIGQEMTLIVEQLNAADCGVRDLIHMLNTCAQAFSADLIGARRDFKASVATGEDLIDVSRVMAAEPQGDMRIDVTPFVDDIVSATYTMERERVVHAQMLASFDEPLDASFG